MLGYGADVVVETPQDVRDQVVRRLREAAGQQAAVMSGARDQVARLLALVPYIQSRREVELEQAASDFGVSQAQIVKDLNVLWFCGMPGLGMGDLIDVDMDALEGEGVIRLSNAEYLSRPLRLDSSEASALIVALRALREGSADDVRPIVDRTLDKLEAAAGDGAAVAAQVDIRMPQEAGRLTGLRDQLTRAVDERRQVRLDYYVPTRDESTERVVDPLQVVTAGGNTYLEAYCHLAEDQRLFRLDRISTAEVLDTPVDEHADLEPRDLADGIFQPSGADLLATLRLAPGGAMGLGVLPDRGHQGAARGRAHRPAPRRGPGLADPADAPAGGLRRAGRPPGAGGPRARGGGTGSAQLRVTSVAMTGHARTMASALDETKRMT